MPEQVRHDERWPARHRAAARNSGEKEHGRFRQGDDADRRGRLSVRDDAAAVAAQVSVPESGGYRRVTRPTATPARGEKVAAWGPSPGFRELRWLRPVVAGDVLSFASFVETKRPSDSRPRWGIVQFRNSGINQRGELAFSFLGTAFVPRRRRA